MIGRRIFSARGSPMTNISFQTSCITGLPPWDARRNSFSRRNEIAKRTWSRQFLMNPWMSLMPVGVKLEGSPCLNYRVVVPGSGYKLEADRKIFVRKSAGDGYRRKPADIANATERIGKSQIGLEIQGQRRRRNRLGCCSEDVKCIKHGIHFLLDDFSHFKGLQVICGGILLVHVARDLPQWIG